MKDENDNLVGFSFVESRKPDPPITHFPEGWNVTLQNESIRRVKVIGTFVLVVDCISLISNPA